MTINVPDNEKMELVYLYVEKANDEEYDLHLDFSQDIQIRWDKDKKEFSIKELDNSLPKNFFGNNIANVTAIAGRNGVGKTTIINFLSSIDRGWSNKSLWILITKSAENFCIEGNIEGILDSDIFRKYYSACGIIDKSFLDVTFLQDSQMRKDLCFLGVEKHDEQEKTMHTFFQRFFINESLYSDIYKFLISKHSTDNFLLHKKNGLSISLPDVKFIDDKMGKEPKKDIYLEDDERIFLALMKKYWERSSFPINKSQKTQSLQQKFLLTFCRFVFDSLFNFILFLRNNSVNSIKTIDEIGINDEFAKNDRVRLEKYIETYSLKITNIMKHFSTDESWRDISLLKKYINELLSFASEDCSDYIHGVKKAYMVRKIFNFDVLLNMFSNFREDFYVSRNTIVFTDLTLSKVINPEQILYLLKECDLWNYKYKISSSSIDCSFGDFSAGEMQLINIFSSIHSKLEQIQNDGYKYIILMLDEYELHLHPEWSRQFLNNLVSVLNTYKLHFQLIFTTHSPYLISDLPKENIILLEKDEQTGRRTARKSNYGFASNYYDIMSDSFFLDDTIGEFAKQKINECIRKMNTITYLLKKIKDKNLVISKLLNKKIPIRMKGIEQIISIVGDPYIKKPLEGMLSVLIDQLNSLKPKQKSLDEILRERQIALQSNGVKND